MTPEQRLDRLERIVMMFARAGARARHEMNEKINILIDAQIKSEDRMAKHEERFAIYDRRFEELGERTDKTLKILMALVRGKQNGNSEDRAGSKH